MIILPAIDLKGGRCVRLRQGRADEVTVYCDDPIAMACHWQEQGATELHVVDLDGAFSGRPAHTATIAAIVAELKIPVEIGGGLRTDEDVAELLATGVVRAIIGTRALEDPTILAELIAHHGGEKIAIGIDARDGRVQVKGWVETTDVRATELARRVSDLGVGTIIYTDTATDGMLQGPNIAAMDEICRTVSCRVIASGGISSVADITALCALGHANLYGAIVGKALYEERVTLPELIAAATQ